MFFHENHFFAIFLEFSTPQSKDFRDFGDPGMCPSLHMGGILDLVRYTAEFAAGR